MEESNSTPKPEKPAAHEAPAPTTTPLQSWPGAFGAYKPSRTAVMRNLSTIVLLFVLALAAGIIIDLVFAKVWWLTELVGGLVGAVFTGAQILAYLASVRGRGVELADMVNQALPMFWKLFLLNLLVGLSIAVGFILLIIPGIIILPRLVLAPYFLMDKQMGILEAYQMSWNQTKGHSGKVWGIIGVTLLMLLPCLTLVGVILTAYWLVLYSASTALLYQFLLDHPTADAQPAAPNPAAT